MFLLALSATALAGEDACTACCRAGGLASCNAELVLYGEGSRMVREAYAWRINGTWTLSCDGRAAYDPSASVLLDHPPLGGELIQRPVTPLQVHCFQEACALPPGIEISKADEDGNFFVLDTESGLAADADALRRAPKVVASPTARVVMLDGRPLVVEPVTSAPVATPAPSPTPSPPPPAPATPSPAPSRPGQVTQWSRPAEPDPPPAVESAPTYSPPASPGPTTTWSAPAPAHSPSAPTPTASVEWSAPAPSPAATPPAPSGSPDLFGTLSASIPADPPAICKAPIEVVRAEARKRVDLGDEKRIQKDAAGAVQQYRAALSMDGCNAYAWLGIGEIAAEAGRPDLSIRTLKNATRLLPGHYGAWTTLGRQYEAMHQDSLAAEAYAKALALRPGLADALEGWRRTASPGATLP